MNYSGVIRFNTFTFTERPKTNRLPTLVTVFIELLKQILLQCSGAEDKNEWISNLLQILYNLFNPQ